MKLSHILPLVVGSAAAILASMSPAHALTYTLNNFTYDNDQYTATGSFDYDTVAGYSNVNVTFSEGATALFTFTDVNSQPSPGWNNNTDTIDYVTTGSASLFGYFHIEGELPFSTIGVVPVGTNSNGYGTYFYLSTVGGNYSLDNNGAYLSGTASAPVPFDIPGGATIPSVGALLALGAMRKARKSLASKTRLANPVCASVS